VSDNNYNIILTNSIKKKLLTKLKSIGYFASTLVYGKINGIIDPQKHEFIEIFKKYLDQKFSYNIYKIKNCRIYTDTINDTAFIIKNKIVKGPSFQFRSVEYKDVKNSDVSKNIVFYKGTARIKRNVRGTVFSLLTGGAGNSNYWHWLFDVLPRIKIFNEQFSFHDLNYFLFPDLKEKFQKDTIKLLNIPTSKTISSKSYRHIYSDFVITTDHPYVIKNNPSTEIQNLPHWILKFLRESFLKEKKQTNLPNKFYIDRKDSKSNHRHLRKIINEDEVKDFLIGKGFSIITLSNLSFEEQVILFNNAKQIVGLHGAGFANLTFCKPRTSVLEIKPQTAGAVIGNLAKNLQLNYNEISIKPSENFNNDQQGLITVPINLLEKKIEIDYN
tara:strand:- start:489 stop:1646 length:1158 start_codon:yes stop_codon:yes gene_type:complete